MGITYSCPIVIPTRGSCGAGAGRASGVGRVGDCELSKFRVKRMQKHIIQTASDLLILV